MDKTTLEYALEMVYAHMQAYDGHTDGYKVLVALKDELTDMYKSLE